MMQRVKTGDRSWPGKDSHRECRRDFDVDGLKLVIPSRIHCSMYEDAQISTFSRFLAICLGEASISKSSSSDSGTSSISFSSVLDPLPLLLRSLFSLLRLDDLVEILVVLLVVVVLLPLAPSEPSPPSPILSRSLDADFRLLPCVIHLLGIDPSEYLSWAWLVLSTIILVLWVGGALRTAGALFLCHVLNS